MGTETSQQRDTTVTKVSSAFSPKGPAGQVYLASGKRVSMRLWSEEPDQKKTEQAHSRTYETVGYVLQGRAELRIEGQLIVLEPGDSWVVPSGASHAYRVLEPFKAVEATTPPAQIHARDESQ
jgi:quercetin dioxygenase-like cupin family protein